MKWTELNWPQVSELPRELPVVLPLGSCEQHGPHLPTGVDTFQVTALAEALEQRLGEQAVLLPPLWLGSSHHHRDFPGTVSVRPSVYSQIIRDVVEGLLHVGFRRVFLLNGHGGNEVPAAQALCELVAENDQADARYLALSSWWQAGADALDPKKLGMATPSISHACEYETSFMLFARPELWIWAKRRHTSRPSTTRTTTATTAAKSACFGGSTV